MLGCNRRRIARTPTRIESDGLGKRPAKSEVGGGYVTGVNDDGQM